jgi:glucans biosynthesis protein C
MGKTPTTDKSEIEEGPGAAGPAPSPSPAGGAPKPARRVDLDWLRILAVLLLVPFHSALVFVLNPHSVMYIKDTVNSPFLDRAAGWVHQFHMPLLFAVAGASTWFALGARSPRRYAGERTLRLLVPFAFGVVALLPPMTWITRLAAGNAPSLARHWLGFFRIDGSDLAGIGGTWTPAHLWFILFLLVFSLAALPLLAWLRGPGGGRARSALGTLLSLRNGLALPGVAMALAAAVGLLGDKNPLVYFVCFVSGFVLVSDERIEQAIDRDWPAALTLAIVFEVVRQTRPEPTGAWSLAWIGYGLAMSLNRWLWVVAWWGLARRFLRADGAAYRYLAEAAYPFYVLHLPLDTLVAFLVVRSHLPVAAKYGLIVGLTTIAAFAVYEAARRIRPLRFLLGMRPARAGRATA